MIAPTERNLTIHRAPTLRRVGVPEALLLASSELSPEARIVGLYILSRPAGWHLCLDQVRVACGLGDTCWRRVSTELRRSGHLKSSKVRVSGKYVWRFEAFELPSQQQATNTIRSFSTGGTASHGERPEKSRARSKIISLADRKRAKSDLDGIGAAKERVAIAQQERENRGCQQSHGDYYAAFGLVAHGECTDVAD